MPPPCSSSPPRRFSLSPPLCSLPCYPLPLLVSCSFSPLLVAAPFSVSLSLLPSRPSPSAPLPSRLVLVVFSFVLRCFHRRYSFYAPAPLPSPMGGGAPRDPYGTSKLVALKLYTGARETAIASHFQHMACGPLARFRGRYRTLWIVHDGQTPG